MIIKKFQANTETEAIMLAKEELGKDAIVMNIKTITPRGIYRLFKKTTVEITAAVDEGMMSGEKLQNKVAPKAKEVLPNIFDVRTTDDDMPVNPGLKADSFDKNMQLEKRLNEIQNMIEKQIQEKPSTGSDVPDNDKSLQNDKNIACIRLIYNQLISNEVNERFANQVITEIENSLKKDAAIDSILAGVYQKLVLKLGQAKTLDVVEGKTKFIFFIGPTGVGKTTTIAKIASTLSVGKKFKIALVTADTYRVAAVEQIRTYANILDVPLHVIYDPEEIAQAKEQFKDYDIVLVDTAGRSHRNREQRDDIERLIAQIPEDEREVYLVLSITTKYRDLVKITETYAEISDFRLIFTKLDETDSVGNILNIRMLTGAPLSYSTFGQNVPNDISKLDAQIIAKQLLGGND